MPRAKKTDKKDEQIADLTTDIKRLRADFENYRKQVDREKLEARTYGAEKATLDMLPVIDNIERAIAHIPEDISEHQWVRGIEGLIKQLDKTLANLGLSRIEASAGTHFNPEMHQAVQFDEEGDGENEVIETELQPGYTLHDRVIRPAMVRVKRG